MADIMILFIIYFFTKTLSLPYKNDAVNGANTLDSVIRCSIWIYADLNRISLIFGCIFIDSVDSYRMEFNTFHTSLDHNCITLLIYR